MPSRVSLCVYDLSDGIVGAVSKPLLRKYFEGIWHTSVVVFNKEVHYRKQTGIQVNTPGDAVLRSGFRRKRILPKHVINMGWTSLEEQTFDAALVSMREIFTPKNVWYNVLAFNCIYFTQECIRCLTGGSIPPRIKDLAVDVFVAVGAAVFRQAVAILECLVTGVLTVLQTNLEGAAESQRHPIGPGVRLLMVPVRLGITGLELIGKAGVAYLAKRRAARRGQPESWIVYQTGDEDALRYGPYGRD